MQSRPDTVVRLQGWGWEGGQRQAQPSVRPAGSTSLFSLTLVSLISPTYEADFFSWQAIVQAPLLPPSYLVFLLPAVAARSVHSYLLTLRWRTFWMKRLTTWYLLVELRDLLKKLLKEKCGFLRILLRFIVTALLSWLHCCAAVMIQFKGHWFLHLLLLLLLLGTIQPVKTDEICLMWLWKELPINAKHFPGGKVPIELNYGKCRIHWFWSFTCSWD